MAGGTHMTTTDADRKDISSTDRPTDRRAIDAPQGNRGGWRREIVSLLAFVVALAAARSSLADHYHVPTGSMIPTVAIGDHVVVNKMAYGLRVPFLGRTLVGFAGPTRGDVVVLDSPEDGATLLKRVVAVPGDLVEVHGGLLSINGNPVEVELAHGGAVVERLGTHPHVLQLTRGGGYDYGPVVVGKDQFLVLGDNRGESHDGRAFGLVERQAIFGRALAVWLRHGGLCWRRL